MTFFSLNNLTPQAFATSSVQQINVIGFVTLDPLFGDDFIPKGTTACLIYDDSSGNKNLFTGSDACYIIGTGGYYNLKTEIENNQNYDIYVRLYFKNDIVSIQKNSDMVYIDTSADINYAPTNNIYLYDFAHTSTDETNDIIQSFAWVHDAYFFALNNLSIDVSQVNVSIIDPPSGKSPNYLSDTITIDSSYFDKLEEKFAIGHEYGHHVFDNVYKNDDVEFFYNPIVVDCSDHKIINSSSLGCAYEEGWGNAFGLFVSDRTLYDDGDLYSFENRKYIEKKDMGSAQYENPTFFINGSDVEGNVAAFFLDLEDISTDNGNDDKSGLINEVFRVIKEFTPVDHLDLLDIWNGDVPYDPNYNTHENLDQLAYYNTLIDKLPNRTTTEEIIFYDRMSDLSKWEEPSSFINGWREKSSFTLASSVDCMTSECHLILDRNIDLFNYENFSLQFKYIARHSTYNNTVPQVVTYDKPSALNVSFSDDGVSWSDAYPINGAESWKNIENIPIPKEFTSDLSIRFTFIPDRTYNVTHVALTNVMLTGMKKIALDIEQNDDVNLGTSNSNWQEVTATNQDGISDTVLEARGCSPNDCVTTSSQSIDLTNYNAANLSFWFSMSERVDNTEGLLVEASNDEISWNSLSFLTGSDYADDQWYPMNTNIDNYVQNSNFNVRFTALSDQNSEIIRLNDVNILGTIAQDTLLTIFNDPANITNNWILSGTDWTIVHESDQYGNNRDFLSSENCDNECILTLANGLNLREYENIFLNFWFYPSTRIDSNDSEGIVIEASDGGTTWDQLAYWNDDNATGSAWNMANLNLDEYYQSEDFKIRFIAKSDDNKEIIRLVDINITGNIRSESIPEYTSLIMYSNNRNDHMYAKSADEITVTLDATRIIKDVTATILDRNATISTQNKTIIATQTVLENDINGFVTFELNINNSTVNGFTVSQDDLTSDNIIIDTIKPVITVLGNNPEFWLQNITYSDAGSFSSDVNNTSYNNTIFSNAIYLDTSVLGEHIITYLAYSDHAGNIPDNKIRTVTVFNTDSYTISSLNITSNNPNSHYAKAGDNITISLQADKLIQNANITIDNQQAIPHIGGNNLIANLTIHENTTNGNATFNITLIDVLTITQISELNLTDSNVYIDTMSPIITISPENVTIERGTAYVDTGVTIFDNDPTYNGTVSSNVSSININTVGSYLIEYHAPSDLAGNVPNNVTKMVTIQDTKHPTITILNITTNNPSGTHAAANQKLTITLETNEILTGTNATILNQAITMNVSDTSASASVTIPENYPANNATFSIAVRDAQNNTLYVTEANLTSNNIFIDTEKPVITLTGPANITIKRGMEYVDTGATISDNDPAYNGTISSNATRLDTNIPGEHIISYQATNDAAGNEAANATRLVTVLYTAPSQISASIKSNNTDTMRAKAGDMLNITLTANKPISHAEGTIMGRMADTIIQNDTVHTTIIIKQEDVNGNATFSITIYDDFSNFTSNETTLDSANVLIDTVIPTKTNLTIYSNNSNTSRAKAGDVLNITLVTDERISDATIRILERNTAYVIQNDTIYANITVESYDSDNATFTITAYDLSMNELTVSEFNLDSTNIFVDNTPPIIDLNGSDIVLVHTGSVYNDADVTVWDNDLGYAGSVTSNATLLGTSDGTYTIVYSAPPDPAGNDAKNATRTIIISPLLEIYNVTVNTTNPNPGYAKENDTLVIRLESNMSLANASVSATVFGRQADYSIYDQILYVNQTVKKGDNGHVPFTILIQDNQGASMLVTKDDLQKNIVVDTTVPQMLSASTITPTLVSMTFDESIAISSTITRRTTMTPTPMSISVQDGSSNVLEFVISSESSLSSDATPHIMIPTSPPIIRDLAGNAAPEISITVSDGIAPSMQSAIVTSSSLIEVMFDEEIKFLDGNPPFRPAPTVNGRSTDTPRDIFGDILHIPSQNAFPIDAVLNVSIRTTIITDIAGNVFEANTILTSAPNVLVPYTVDELTIHVPYAMTLSPNTLSTGDYRITFGSNPPSAISIVDLSGDATTVILTMNTRFGTGDIPFVEQIGTITDTFNNNVTMQSAIADDRAPPTLVSVIASSPSDITVTFSEKISSKSTSIQNYDLSGATIRNTGLGIADGTVVISTSTFVKASILISTSTTIEDISNNVIQGGVTQSVIKN